MSQLRPYQACRKNDGWIPILVESSKGGFDYTVHVSPWGEPRDNICECKGYIMKGVCRHQVVAQTKVCRWTELNGEEQSPEEFRNRRCPRCGGPTKWELEIEDEQENS